MLKNLMGIEKLNITGGLYKNISLSFIDIQYQKTINSDSSRDIKENELDQLRQSIEKEWKKEYKGIYIELLKTLYSTSQYFKSPLIHAKNQGFIEEENLKTILLSILNNRRDFADSDNYQFIKDFNTIFEEHITDKKAILSNKDFIFVSIANLHIFFLEKWLGNFSGFSPNEKIEIYKRLVRTSHINSQVLKDLLVDITNELVRTENQFSETDIKEILSIWNTSYVSFDDQLKKSLLEAKDSTGNLIYLDVTKEYLRNISIYRQLESKEHFPQLTMMEYINSSNIKPPKDQESQKVLLNGLLPICKTLLITENLSPDNAEFFFEAEKGEMSLVEKSIFISGAKEQSILFNYLYNFPFFEKDLVYVENLINKFIENQIFKSYIEENMKKEFSPDDVGNLFLNKLGNYEKEIKKAKENKKSEKDPEELEILNESIKMNTELSEKVNIEYSIIYNYVLNLQSKINSICALDKYKETRSLYQKESQRNKNYVSSEYKDFWLYSDADFEKFKQVTKDYRSEDDVAHVWVKKLSNKTGKRKIATNKALMNNIVLLREMFPNFERFIDYIEDNLYLHAIGNNLLKINPCLLVSKPGIGKTFFLSTLARLAGTSYEMINMESLTGGFILTGLDSRYSTGSPGLFFQTMLDSPYVNNLLILDEIDKCSPSKTHGGVEDALLPLLEGHSAKSFKDECLQLPIDMSHVNWIATANDASKISAPLTSRLKRFDIRSPNLKERKILGQGIYSLLLNDNAWGKGFNPNLSSEVLDRLCSDSSSSRDLRINLETAIARCSRRETSGIREIKAEDIDFQESLILQEWDMKKYEDE